ncbi:MAG: DUF3822 family protein [Bacteroidales bacterium]|nr:DUF3822 family protein [Bacteroidales bacterium]MCR5697546.1 DUF3822 family protein [Marinilabiliaceae bacterium]
MSDIRIIGSNYKEQLSTSYNLSIRLWSGGLSFSVYDSVTNKILVICSNTFSMPDEHYAHQEQIMMCDELLNKEYKRVIISIEGRPFTIMPQMLDDESRNKQLLDFAGIPTTDEDVILTDHLDEAGAKLLYPISRFLYYFLRSQYKNVEIRHAASPIAEWLLTKRIDNNRRGTICINITDQRLLLVAVDGNKLVLCNEFECNDTNDFVYMAMNAIEQIKFNSEGYYMDISGDITNDDERVRLLKRFGRNAELATFPSLIDYDFIIPSEQHRYINVIKTALCV